LEKITVKRELTGCKTARPRSRPPLARRAPCRHWLCRAQGTAPPRRPCWPDSHHLEVQATRSPSHRHPRNACRIFYRVVPAPSVPRSVARATVERVHQGPSPYCGVTPSFYFNTQAEEPAGYKIRPRCRAQAGRHGPPLTPPRRARPPALSRSRVAP
jgi:hypothetical protein